MVYKTLRLATSDYPFGIFKRSLCSVLETTVCIVASDYPFGIFKLFTV
jgi:hypothetical protein